jgi:hypothetical protein
MGDAGRCFWGPDGIWSRTTDCCVKAAVGFRALVARQAAAILRLRGLLAEQRAAMAIAEDAIAAGGAPGGAPPPAPPAHPRPPPAAAKRTHDGGGDLTLDEVRPPLRNALKLTKPRSAQPSIGGSLNRSTVYRRMGR